MVFLANVFLHSLQFILTVGLDGPDCESVLAILPAMVLVVESKGFFGWTVECSGQLHVSVSYLPMLLQYFLR